jgi:citrate lyase subunit beta/citryl-CoA lyase
MLQHPEKALYDGAKAPMDMVPLPVVDHYAGVEARMRKSLALQAERAGPQGPTFDVTLDLEDGAPVGGEADHAAMVVSLLSSAANRYGRVGVRVHDATHPCFEADLAAVAAAKPAYVMVPKVERLADIDRAAALLPASLPLHVLIESAAAVAHVAVFAAHPQVASVSFGLMDFVSAHRGAIPEYAMTAAGQFQHPLVVRAKLEISAACHAQGKVPSHGVVTEFADGAAVEATARRAALEMGYLRMWSIHPDQIAPILRAFAPSADEVAMASDVLLQAQQLDWAPIRFVQGGQARLHDRASYRYFWQVLQRAARTGLRLPAEAQHAFFSSAPSATDPTPTLRQAA